MLEKNSKKSQTIVLALGSNMGDRLAHMRQALKLLDGTLTVRKLSPIYETAAMYVTDQPAFLNAALIGDTRLEPLALLWSLKRLELEIGRQPTFRYGPRSIDLDIIFYGDTLINTPELTIPHRHVAEREFVLRPLADIAPEWIHPIRGLTVAEMLKRLPPINSTCLDCSLDDAA